jgi:hypothetical protein
MQLLEASVFATKFTNGANYISTVAVPGGMVLNMFM